MKEIDYWDADLDGAALADPIFNWRQLSNDRQSGDCLSVIVVYFNSIRLISTYPKAVSAYITVVIVIALYGR